MAKFSNVVCIDTWLTRNGGVFVARRISDEFGEPLDIKTKHYYPTLSSVRRITRCIDDCYSQLLTEQNLRKE